MQSFVDEYRFYSERERHLKIYSSLTYYLSKKANKNEFHSMIAIDYQSVVKKMFLSVRKHAIWVYKDDKNFKEKYAPTSYEIEIVKEPNNHMPMPVIHPSEQDRDVLQICYLIRIIEKRKGEDILGMDSPYYFASFSWAKRKLDDDFNILEQKGNWFLSKSSIKGDKTSSYYPFIFISYGMSYKPTYANDFAKNKKPINSS